MNDVTKEAHSEHSRPTTFAGIIAEMREHIAMKMSDAWYTQDEWRNLCNRLEAAVNNEKKANLQGNNAAIREALVMVCDAFTDGLITTDLEKDLSRFDAICEKVKSALSEPARNCDRFKDELDAQLAFLNEVWLISVDRKTMLVRDKYENWSDEMRAKYGRWLLAPVAERKGES